MPKNIFPVVNEPTFVATPEYEGNIVEFGGPSEAECGVVTVQFDPDVDFVGSFAVVGRWRKQSAQSVGAPFLPIGYISVNLNGVAVDRSHSHAVIDGPGMIEVPANGLSVGVMVSCSAGSCTLYLNRLAGTPGSV